MVRSLALAVALALGTVSVPAHALGLGDISSKSALNQQFDANIDLLSVAAGELDSIRVRLASVESFERAGLERPFFLTLLKFRPDTLDNGKTVIRVSSDFPIREPFLNFLVEVNWPRGKLVREYTVLLDPPTTTKRRAPQVQTAPARVETSAPAPQRIPEPAQAQQVGEREYGPIKANETLWGIAKGLRPRGVSMAQMLIALQQANPQAFINGNINQLRVGQILRVPDTEEILQISRQEAQASYRSQQDDWVNQRAGKLQQQASEQSAASAQAAGSDAETQAELRIATARPEGDSEKVGAGEDRGDETVDAIERELLVARENAETSRLETESLRNEIGDLEQRLQDMQRLLSLKDEQLARLQDNVATEGREATPDLDPLEQALRDAQAVAQGEDATASSEEPGSATEQTSEASVAEGTTTPMASQTESAEASEAQAVTEQKTEQKPASEAAAGPEAAKYPILNTYLVQQEGAPEQPQATPAGASEPEPQVKYPIMNSYLIREEGQASSVAQPQPAPEVAEPASVAEAPAQPSTPVQEKPEPETQQPATPAADEPKDEVRAEGDFITDNLPWLAGGGALLVILLLLLLGRKGSKKPDELPVASDQPEESILTAGAETDLDMEAGEESASGADTSFLSEFSPSDINALRDDTGEVDAVSEADVYIAYGRYQQAEDLLRQAMERDPERLALKHKLLEVFYATRNKEAFVGLAQDLQDAGQDIADEEAWSRAKDMGRELDDSNPLFDKSDDEGQGVDVDSFAQAAEADTAPVDEDFNLDDLDLDSLASELNSPDAVDEMSELNLDGMDQDLDKAIEESQPADELDSLELELPEAETKVTEDVKVSEQADDLDLEGESVLSVDDLEAQLDELSDLSVLDTDLSEMSADVAAAEPVDELNTVDDALEDETLDQPISLDDAFESDELDDAQEVVELDESPATPVDEDAVATKLDLARAYLEMGDGEGARSILEEVQKEGTESQKDEAGKMLDSIG